MFRSSRRPGAPALLLSALAALLVLAPVAAAETKFGEGTSSEDLSRSGESDLLKATAKVETVTGTATWTFTTREALASTPKEGRETVTFLSYISSTYPCDSPTVPFFLMEGQNNPLQTLVLFEGTGGGVEASNPVPSLSGTTVTTSATAPLAENQTFNCAAIAVKGDAGEDVISFPLTAEAEPPPPPAPAPVPIPTPGASTKPVLSIAKLKALKLEAGKSKTIRVKVSNKSATATGSGSLRVKAPAGVIVKPERQQMPALAAGRSFSLSIRVELTAKAKPKSTLSLTATASGISAKGSLVVKRTD